MARSKYEIPPIDEYFATVIESQRARGFRLAHSGTLRARRPGSLAREGRAAKARGSREERAQGGTPRFQPGSCDLSAKQGFPKQKPPENSRTFWLILLVLLLTGISCWPSHFSSALPRRTEHLGWLLLKTRTSCSVGRTAPLAIKGQRSFASRIPETDFGSVSALPPPRPQGFHFHIS